jgi:hypothetical protein
VLDEAIFSNAAWYRPVGAGQASSSGEIRVLLLGGEHSEQHAAGGAVTCWNPRINSPLLC